MTPVAVGAPVEQLAGRLAAVAAVLTGTPEGAPDHDAGTLLDQLVRIVQARAGDSSAWLLLTGLVGAFPGSDLVQATRRTLELSTPAEAALWLLDTTSPEAARSGAVRGGLRIVSDRAVVDVDYTARHDLLTGIQRVVRETVPRLLRRHEVLPVAWTAAGGAFRMLTSSEHDYLVDWPGHGAPEPRPPADEVLVVPWETRVVLPEVPVPGHSDRLAALARFSGNAVSLIGYDCIPAVSAELVGPDEREKFGRYLEVVKHAERLAAISHSSAAEFAGFVAALRSQGLPGPTVAAVPLANVAALPAGPVPPFGVDGPVVLCVGSLDRRKNQAVVLDAAEVLWREGLEFTLVLIGGGRGRPADLMKVIEQLQGRGRSLVVRTEAPEAYLQAAYRAARFSVFPSLHEGYGLPIVESLSHQVPVITSDFGSMRECAEGQGGVLVDPRSVPAVADAMRTLLTDDERLAELRAQATARPTRTWDRYADELWRHLVGSEAPG